MLECVTSHERPIAWAKRPVTLRLFYSRPSLTWLRSRKEKKDVEATKLKTKERVASIRDIGRGRIAEAKVRKMREIVACATCVALHV